MATLAALAKQQTTDVQQRFNCPGANYLEITISNSDVYLAFAYRQGPSFGHYSAGVEEHHIMKLLSVSDPIDAVLYRSATPGQPAILSITATT